MSLGDLLDGNLPEAEDGCENAQKVASKYGYHLVCDEDEEKKAKEKEILDPNCENAKKVGSKYGYTIACDEEN